jgi:hypothetical protein
MLKPKFKINYLLTHLKVVHLEVHQQDVKLEMMDSLMTNQVAKNTFYAMQANNLVEHAQTTFTSILMETSVTSLQI